MNASRAIAALAAAIPLTLGTAGTANAAVQWRSSESNKCTYQVSSLLKVDLNPTNGLKRIWHGIKLDCPADRMIRYEAEVWEQDNGKSGDEDAPDDLVYRKASSTYFDPGSPSTRKWYKSLNSSYDLDNTGEFYMRTRVRVKIDGENAFRWSPWLYGRVNPVHV